MDGFPGFPTCSHRYALSFVMFQWESKRGVSHLDLPGYLSNMENSAHGFWTLMVIGSLAGYFSFSFLGSSSEDIL